jgi:hypothetical protein
MDLQTRKIEFIQEFLKIQSEEAISKLEKLLKMEQKSPENGKFQPMTEEELNRRIDQSELDFKEGRYKHHSEIMAKFDQ